MNQLPEGVNLGPFRYTFKQSVRVDGADAWGHTNFVKREITFGEECDAKQMPLTLMHELVHVVEKCYEIPLKEADVTRFANGLTQALQQLGFLPEELELHHDSSRSRPGHRPNDGVEAALQR